MDAMCLTGQVCYDHKMTKDRVSVTLGYNTSPLIESEGRIVEYLHILLICNVYFLNLLTKHKRKMLYK